MHAETFASITPHPRDTLAMDNVPPNDSSQPNESDAAVAGRHLFVDYRHQELAPEVVTARRERADAAVKAERARSGFVVGEPSLASGDDTPATAVAPTSGEPAEHTSVWLKVAVAAAVVAVIGVAGVTVTGGTGDTAAGGPSVTAAPTTAASRPTTSASPTTTSSTTSTTTTTTPPVAPADGNPTHGAIYRDGKLYLEGTVPSQAVAEAYVEKAAAVLGADNVVNNYAIDPTVAESNDGTVYVDEPFLFESGSALINPEYHAVLNLGIAALNLNPSSSMVVTGYTDEKGDPLRNVEISQARAIAVVFYMIQTGGIDPARLEAIGAGSSNPIGDNATEEGRRLNRRIEVKLVNLLG